MATKNMKKLKDTPRPKPIPVINNVVIPTNLTIDDLPCDPKLIETLTNMGFSPYSSKKALLLYKMNIQNATNYLLSGNLDIGTPLTQKEITQIYQSSKSLMEKPLRETEIDEAYKLNICTFTTTGPDFKTQQWYSCVECGLDISKGLCEICAKVCHKGHTLIPMKVSPFFCDCGAGESKHACKCLDYETLDLARDKEKQEREELEKKEKEKKNQSLEILAQTIQSISLSMKKEGMVQLNVESKYNSNYVCSILGYEIVQNEFRLTIDVKGDQSVGDLQNPLQSRLSDENGINLSPTIGQWTLSDPKYRHKGYLSFDASKMQKGEKYYFQYGLSGYSKVFIFQN